VNQRANVRPETETTSGKDGEYIEIYGYGK
jgi:hypothetical protein